MTQEIHAAAGAVAEVRLNADQATAASVEAATHRDRIRSRISVLESDRSAIAAERKGGVDDPAHCARLAVIAVDLDGLGQILAEAHQAVAKAGAEVAAANSTVTAAEAALAAASDGELLRRLTDHADTLDGLLFETVSDIAAVAQNRHDHVQGLRPLKFLDRHHRDHRGGDAWPQQPAPHRQGRPGGRSRAHRLRLSFPRKISVNPRATFLDSKETCKSISRYLGLPGNSAITAFGKRFRTGAHARG